MDDVLVSVVIIFYNEKEFLAQAIDSILGQSYDNIEVLLIDDCSNDGSDEIAKEYCERYDRLKYYRNATNAGAARCRNVGICESKGEYIAFLDGDDYSVPDRIRIQADYLNEHDDVVAVSGGLRCFNQHDSASYSDRIINIEDKSLRNYLLFSNPFAQPAAMVRRYLYTDKGLLQNEKYKSSQDYDYWLKCLLYGNLHIIPQVLVYYRVHDSHSTKFQKKNSELYDEWMYEIITNGWKERGIILEKQDVEYIYNILTRGSYIWEPKSFRSFLRLNRIIRFSGISKENSEAIVDMHKRFYKRFSLYYTPFRVLCRVFKRVA